MISCLKIITIPASACFAAVLALLVFAVPVRAAAPIFPLASRVGLVPPAGMVVSNGFPGFEDAAKKAAIVITTMPADAYSAMEKSAVPDAFKKQGITMEKREPIKLSVGPGFLIIGRQSVDKTQYRKWLLVVAASDFTAVVSVQTPEQDATYSEAVLRATLATLAVRATIPDAERLSVLPFTVGNLAGFQIEGVLPGRALMLADIPSAQDSDAHERTLSARLIVSALQGGPAEGEDRGNFARMAFDTIAGIKDVKINMSEPLRFGNQQGYQTMAQAKESQSNADIMVVQWLRFGSGAFLHMVGIAGADIWASELSRMRTVRDSIEPK